MIDVNEARQEMQLILEQLHLANHVQRTGRDPRAILSDARSRLARLHNSIEYHPIITTTWSKSS